MNLTIILLTAAMLQVFATGVSQTVSFNGTNVSLHDVLSAIKKQTNFSIAYNKEAIEKANPVTLNVTDLPLKEFLKQALKGQGLDYSIENTNIAIFYKPGAPSDANSPLSRVFTDNSFGDLATFPITGRIVDAAGAPLSGASISVKGSKNSTSTKADGTFTINANEGDILVVSYVGYLGLSFKITQSPGGATIAVVVVTGKAGENAPLSTDRQPTNTEGEGNNAESLSTLQNTSEGIIVTLTPSVSKLDEVSIVSTGYQDIPAERATGSFTKIDSKVLNQQMGPNVLNRLSGVASGVLFSKEGTNSKSKLNLLVRGQSTINGPGDPLIILDNFPYEGDINNLNPNDIESITILKDAAAASIWGTKAGNGVVVITTKKSKFNQKTKIEFNSNVTSIQRPDLFSIPRMDSKDMVDVEIFLFQNKYRFTDTSNRNKLPFTDVYETLFKYRKKQISPADSALLIDGFKSHDVRNDFQNYMYRAALNQQYSINISGGAPNISWYFSGGLDKNVGSLYENYRRVNLRTDNTFTLFKGASIRTGLIYSNSLIESGRTAFGTVTGTSFSMPQYTQLFDNSGAAIPLYKDYRKVYLDTAGAGLLKDWRYYPGTDYQHATTTNTAQDFLGNLAFSYKLGDFNFEARYQYENQTSDGKTLNDEQSYTARHFINFYSQIDRAAKTVKYNVPVGGILDLSNSKLINHSARAQLGYSKGWSDHNVAAIIGTELRQTKISRNNYRTYGYNDDILTSVPVDYVNPYPTFITGASNYIPNSSGFGRTTDRFVSQFANASYTYKDRYTVSASARRDASNLFGLSTNDKWTPLWSAGVAWNASKEGFYNFDILPLLKFRGTFGYQGNVDQSRAAITTISYASLTSNYTKASITNFSTFYNPELRWEKVGTYNLGIDFGFKKGFLTGSVEFYQKNARDLYANVEIDQTLGLGRSQLPKNAATLRTKGIDVVLNSINIDGAFRWTSNFIYSYSRDEILKYFFNNYGIAALQTGKALSEGNSIYGVYSLPWAGLDPNTGEAMGLIKGVESKDYSALASSERSPDDMVYHGSRLPTSFGSLSNTISWKQISLTAMIAYRFGYYFRANSIDYNALVRQGVGHSDYYDRWQKPGDEKITNVPAFRYPVNTNAATFYNYSSPLVDKGDNIRLQFIHLNYEINRQSIPNFPFQRMNIYVNVSDIGVIWKATKRDVDPDNQGMKVPARYAGGINFTL